MHPEYPDLESHHQVMWKKSLNVPVQPFSPEWEFPMLVGQIEGPDLKRLNDDLADLVIEQEEKIKEYTVPSEKSEKHPSYDLTSSYEDWNFFYLDHPAAETLFNIYKDAHDTFIQRLNVVHRSPLCILAWANALREEENNRMGEHSHQGEVRTTYLSTNYCVTADSRTSTVFDVPGFNGRKEPVQNQPGQIQMFPEWVNHFTTPMKGDEDVRVTIAADIEFGHIEQYRYHEQTGEKIHYVPFDMPPTEKARRQNIPVGETPGVDGEVAEFINTPLDEIRNNEDKFNFRGR